MTEINLTGLTTATKGTWAWVKENWLTLVLAVSLIGCAYVMLSQKSAMNAVLEQYRAQITESHNDITQLESVVESERTARETMQREFNERINEIDERYTKAINDIRRDRARRIRELMENTPELDNRFGERFGIPE